MYLLLFYSKHLILHWPAKEKGEDNIVLDFCYYKDMKWLISIGIVTLLTQNSYK